MGDRMYSSDEFKELRKRERIIEKRVQEREKAEMIIKSRQENAIRAGERIPFAIFCLLVVGAIGGGGTLIYKHYKDKYVPDTRTERSSQLTGSADRVRDIEDMGNGKSESKRKYDEFTEQRKLCKGLTNPISKFSCYCSKPKKGKKQRRYCRILQRDADRFSRKRNASAKRMMGLRLY